MSEDDEAAALAYQEQIEQQQRLSALSDLLLAQIEMSGEKEAKAIRKMLARPVIRAGRQHAGRPLYERLMERAIFGATDCWHWNGRDNGHGYGRMTYEGRSQVAHRLAWIAWRGPIPDGMYVLHRCDNRYCINPEHLWLGTYSDNLKDCWSKGRHPGKGGKRHVVHQ